MTGSRDRSTLDRWIAIAFAAGRLASAANAGLHLVSTDPPDGAVSSAVDCTVSLTFVAPIDSFTFFNDTRGPHFLGMKMHPLERSGRPDSTRFSPDLKTVRFRDPHLFFDTR